MVFGCCGGYLQQHCIRVFLVVQALFELSFLINQHSALQPTHKKNWLGTWSVRILLFNFTGLIGSNHV
jgi:hypothetical protein